MRKNFRTYGIAVEFYQLAIRMPLKNPLREQLHRAASSIVLNLAEGAGRQTRGDKLRFYSIAFGSLRECQAIIDLSPRRDSSAAILADKLAAHIYCLIKSMRG